MLISIETNQLRVISPFQKYSLLLIWGGKIEQQVRIHVLVKCNPLLTISFLIHLTIHRNTGVIQFSSIICSKVLPKQTVK